MREYQTPGGRLLITIRDPVTGAIVLERCIQNLVTLTGRRLLAEMLAGAAGVAQMHLLVGGPPSPADSGYQTRPAALGDTALQNPLRSVPVVTSSPVQREESPGQTRVFMQLSGTLEAEVGSPPLVMTEAGISITKVDGTSVLYNRVVFDRITKQAEMQMTLTWEVIF